MTINRSRLLLGILVLILSAALEPIAFQISWDVLEGFLLLQTIVYGFSAALLVCSFLSNYYVRVVLSGAAGFMIGHALFAYYEFLVLNVGGESEWGQFRHSSGPLLFLMTRLPIFWAAFFAIFMRRRPALIAKHKD